MKAATPDAGIYCKHFLISIHAAREGGDLMTFHISRNEGISIHAAREGGDDSARKIGAGEAISIHAAREGGDAVTPAPCRYCGNFNPRRP